MSTHRLMPPASFRLRTRLAHVRCGFCGCREKPDETGRIITIPHPKGAICELCIDEADVMADCARLARFPAKPTPKRLVKPRGLRMQPKAPGNPAYAIGARRS